MHGGFIWASAILFRAEIGRTNSWRKASRYEGMVAFLDVASGFTPRFFITDKELAVASGFTPRFCGLRGVNQCDSWHKAGRYRGASRHRRRFSRSERVYPSILWFASFSHGACNASHSGSGRCLGNLSTNHCASLLKIFQYGQTSLVAKSCAR